MKATKTVKTERTIEARVQYAALPWRAADRPEILLVSSRGTHRWIIPKGWPMKGRRPHAAAAQEALEEAGIIGKVGKETLGAYHYFKRPLSSGAYQCKVFVFPLTVIRQRKSWPERSQRITRWFTPDEAARAVQEPELKELITDFGRRLELTVAQI